MKRRDFIAGSRRRSGMADRGARAAGRADAAYRRAHARTADDAESQARLGAFQQGLELLGLDDRPQSADRYPLGSDGCRRRSQARGGIGCARAGRHSCSGNSTVGPLLQATRTVPIVFPLVTDPVGAGFVDSLARPGGNATGFLSFEYSMSGKWLELLKEIAPGVTRVAVLRDPAVPSGIGQFAVIQAVAPSLRVEVSPVRRARRRRDRARRHGIRAQSNGGLIVTASPLAVVHRDLIVTLGGPAQAARGLSHAGLRHQRRPDFVWAGFRRPVSARCRLRRSHPQGREAGRPAGAGADQVRDW